MKTEKNSNIWKWQIMKNHVSHGGKNSLCNSKSQREGVKWLRKTKSQCFGAN